MGIAFDFAVVNRYGPITRPAAEHICFGASGMQTAWDFCRVTIAMLKNSDGITVAVKN